MIIKTILKAFKPFQLMSLITTYLMGAGLVQYVRGMRSQSGLFEGLIFLLLVMISTQLIVLGEKIKDPDQRSEYLQEAQIKQVRWIIPMLTATLLTGAATFFVGWAIKGVLWQGLGLIIAAIIISCAVYFLTEVINRFQSLNLFIETILYLVLPPGFAFFLQSSDNHSFLIMIVTCLVPAFLAYGFLIQIKRFGVDQKKGNQTIAVQLGWERTMVFHNALILLTYFLFALMALIAIPWFLVWPVFLTFPIGLVSIWLVEQMRRGKKPLWRMMRLSDAVVFFFPIYLVGIAFWIR